MNGCFLFGKDLTLKENEKRRPLPLEPSPSGSWDNGKADNSLQFQSQAKLNTFYFRSLQFSQNLTPMKRKLQAQAGLFLNLLCPMPVGSNLLALLKENPNNPIRRLVAVPCKHIADDIDHVFIIVSIRMPQTRLVLILDLCNKLIKFGMRKYSQTLCIVTSSITKHVIDIACTVGWKKPI